MQCSFSGYVSAGCREPFSKGASLPDIIGNELGPAMKLIMRVLSLLLLILVGTVFTTTSAGLLGNLTGQAGFWGTKLFWIIIIFIYFLLATVLPIDTLIGRFYPVFGLALLIMAIGVMGGIFVNDGFMPSLTDAFKSVHPQRLPIFPMLFVTIACGAVSGFHGTQSPLMARCIKDEKFEEKMKDYIIYKNLDGKYISQQEYLDAAKEKHENQIFYVTDEVQQSQYINMFKEQGLDAVLLRRTIDQPFIQKLEAQNEGLRFIRIDAELADIFKEEASEDEKAGIKEQEKKLTDIFRKALSIDNLEVRVEKLKNADTSAMIPLSEDVRRMQDMMKMYGMNMPQTMGDEGQTLVLNANNDLVKYVFENPEGEHTALFCQQIYDLAYLSLERLDAEAMTRFIGRSNEILKLLADK